ncbi:lipopolysaccharide biosynthesis protein [Staphylococcus equorum]|uniref:lipopolysaccharide biosynthesis protein n=1 Tax=Staphylococcus equorum TaxID=246432 RepID=UPI0020CC4777|nr:polysaccharide biosynthesis C-terminal domain-containing protein [Staphylococcus equorum]MEB7715535.1 polysaccharide biosynthesis C-terminal domain-containing protein [Staphylococcus equorum]MEB7759890.1 polysaccharide biosynthesis C-terminal domain-containing protein [Staphylococcus equorum]MEB7762365.1 polysaccharide biosynthesis C-terminal domain-containing protein [Staphylococcus equorum]MEB7793469.1 polysaccharide biosynthesis C-terminal domain-containing protein [Staphylococcus equorum
MRKKFNKTVSNNKVVINNIISAFVIKGGAMVVSFLTIPAYLIFFSNYKILGFWFTILSVLTWMLAFDLGIGNGLRNKLVKSFVEKDELQIKKYISSSYLLIGTVVLFIVILFGFFKDSISWNYIFNIPKDIISENVLSTVIYILFIGIMIQFFLRIISSILYAMQKSFMNNLNLLLSNIIILFFLKTFKFDNISEQLSFIAIVYSVAINFPIFITTLIIFTTVLKKYKPHFNYFSLKHSGEILQLGLAFFWVQIMYMLLTTTNEFLISWFSNPEDVVVFQIYNRIFTLIGTIFSLALIPIWSIVTKAFAEKDYIWIKSMYSIFVVIGLIVMLLEFVIIPFLQIIVDFWLQDKSININPLYSFLFAIYGSMIIWIGVNNNFANGLGKLRTQTVFFTLGVIIKIPLSWYFIELLDSWIGVLIASILSLSLYCIIQPIWLRKHLNRYIL